MNYPIRIWLLTEQTFEKFIFSGGKVIYIVEEPDPKFKMHPAIITAGALLPPIDAIQLELDGRFLESSSIYEQYLQTKEADLYVSILIAAAIKQMPIGIMFGRDELNMHFPKMFVEFLYKYYGIVLGSDNGPSRIEPYILTEAIPFDLAKLYNMGIIDSYSFFQLHPSLPIHDSAIGKLAYEINPAMKDKTFENYKVYFNNFKEAVRNSGGKVLIDPLVSV